MPKAPGNRAQREPTSILGVVRTGPPSDQPATTPAVEPSHWAARLAPSRIVAFAVLAAMPIKLLARRLEDPDLWWHLKTGALIVRNHAIPAVDPFSYTAPGKHCIVQEWL